jgi:hypothetical protein
MFASRLRCCVATVRIKQSLKIVNISYTNIQPLSLIKLQIIGIMLMRETRNDIGVEFNVPALNRNVRNT